jgi:LPXTG-site transpeptidase (sortase) family protein
MTTVPRRAGRLAACRAANRPANPRRGWTAGLAGGLAAAALLLAGTPAAAVTQRPPQPRAAHQRPPQPHPQAAHHGAPVRELRLARAIRREAEPQATDRNKGRRPPPRRPEAKRHAKRSPAWSLDIPSIAVDAKLMPLGEPANGAGPLVLATPPLSVAASTAGWYDFSARPGAAGNSVIVGHVDTYAGRGVFYNLYQLRPGTAVYVTAGGARQRFAVTSAGEMAKSSFPVNKVFGATGKHMLWLITCGGDFDYATGHYQDNVAISAVWVPPHGKQTVAAKK